MDLACWTSKMIHKVASVFSGVLQCKSYHVNGHTLTSPCWWETAVNPMIQEGLEPSKKIAQCELKLRAVYLGLSNSRKTNSICNLPTKGNKLILNENWPFNFNFKKDRYTKYTKLSVQGLLTMSFLVINVPPLLVQFLET